MNSQISGSGEIVSTEKNAEEQGGGQESGKQAEDNKNVSRLRTDISRLQKQLNAMSERYDGLIVQENTNRQFYTANEIHRNALKKKY
ncbi:MAG: hypothetical protein V7784_20085 [Oceanospirillaceae bacterium]